MIRKHWKAILLLLSLGSVAAVSLLAVYVWYFSAPTGTLLFILRQQMAIALNWSFPNRFPSPYGEMKVQGYVPKEEKPTTIRILRGVVKDKKLEELVYAVDVSGITYYIQFDEQLLRAEEQHVLIPYFGSWNSIVISEGKPVNLLCTGDVVEIRIEGAKQRWQGDSWETPLSPENVIVAEEGRSCLPREADQRNLERQ